MTARREAGVTLIEVLIAVTLLSVLSIAMVIAMRVGLTAFSKTDSRLMDNRRVAGAQRVLLEEIEGMVPVVTKCGAGPAATGRYSFFQGEEQAMRLVSTFSLQQGWRGQPQILEFTVIPGDQGRGERLVVNEIPYTGALSAGRFCLGPAPDPMTGLPGLRFAPIETGPHSFVLADKLESCRFSYFYPARDGEPPAWRPRWSGTNWPMGVRVEMAPLETDPGRVQPIAVTAPIHVYRSTELDYDDM
jgi:prepilin-type N-terminal cleavage/methylation domain-containing protein